MSSIHQHKTRLYNNLFYASNCILMKLSAKLYYILGIPPLSVYFRILKLVFDWSCCLLAILRCAIPCAYSFISIFPFHEFVCLQIRNILLMPHVLVRVGVVTNKSIFSKIRVF